MPTAIGSLADDPELRRLLGDAARDTFETRFTAERAAGAMIDLYRWAAGEVVNQREEPEAGTPATTADPESPSGAALGRPRV